MSRLSEPLPSESTPMAVSMPMSEDLSEEVPAASSPEEAPEVSPYGDGIPEVAPTPAERHYPSTLGGLVYIGILVATLVGLGISATGAWRQGVAWIGCAMLAGAATRGVLSDDNAGMLRVRRKLLDMALLAFAGVLLLVLAVTIPDQS